MIIDGRGADVSAPYDQVERLLTQDGCLLEDHIEVWVDSESAAKKINVLATLAGYDTVTEEAKDGWVLKIDTGKRRCL